MYLRTLGGLRLRDSHFQKPKPLLLLVYLAVEGPRNRRFLAELFWPGAANHMNSLAKALSQLRQAVPEVAQADEATAWTNVQSDVAELLDALDKGDLKRAVEFYRGPFLEGFYLKDWSVELEEWVYATREFLASRARDALLSLAEKEAANGDLEDAVRRAEAAYTLNATPELDPMELSRIHTLLLLGNSAHASSAYTSKVRAEAESYGMILTLTAQEAGVHLVEHAKPPPIPNNLPTRGTTFVGRELEIAELSEMLHQDACRLVTLAGQGGTGKTRLALQVARDQLAQGHFKDGVYFVPLETLTTATTIPSRTAEALELTLQGQDDPLTQVRCYLKNKRMLLVLDNYEHLLDGAAFVADLLSACQALSVLVTSRERLHLEEEWLFTLGGLLSPSDEAINLDEAQDFDAVNLFVERATRVQRDFRLTVDTWRDVGEICRLVGGSPLAIELAATWLRAMSLTEIAHELQSNLDLLMTDTPNIPDRHQSIRATFGHSWQLLTLKEQEVLRKLSVFRSGFRREAAREVADAAIPALASLLDKSLLRMRSNGRYDFHPLLHHYAQEKLTEHPEAEAEAQRRHGAYYLHLLQRLGELSGFQRQDMLKAVDEERENILVAWRWRIDARTVSGLEQLSEALAWYFEVKGRHQEGAGHLAEAMSLLDERKVGHRRALGYLRVHFAWLLHWSENELAAQAARHGLHLLRPLGERSGMVLGLRVLGLIAWRQGNYREAERYYREGLHLTEGLASPELRAILLDALGMVLANLGNYVEARRCYHEALAINERIPNPFQRVHNLVNLASVARRCGNLTAALPLAQRALELAQKTRFEHYLPYCLSELSWVRLAMGVPAEAQELALEALQRARELGESFSQIKSLVLLVLIAVELGHLDEAQTYLRDGIGVAWSIQDFMLALQALGAAAQLAWRRGELPRAAEWASLVKHHPASPASNVVAAERLLELLQDHLSKEAMCQAQVRGKTTNLEEVVEAMLNEFCYNHSID